MQHSNLILTSALTSKNWGNICSTSAGQCGSGIICSGMYDTVLIHHPRKPLLLWMSYKCKYNRRAASAKLSYVPRWIFPWSDKIITLHKLCLPQVVRVSSVWFEEAPNSVRPEKSAEDISVEMSWMFQQIEVLKYTHFVSGSRYKLSKYLYIKKNSSMSYHHQCGW